MDAVVEFITQNIAWAPYIIFGMLLLAGFNIPVSEDGMLLISGILAAKYPDHLVPLFVGVYMGAYLSDLICYGLGRYFGNHIWKVKLLAKMVTRERVDKISRFYEKYGFLTLLFGRFIPFGVRNGLFLTAGLGKMNAIKFAVSDWIAATISCSLFFTLYYHLGKNVVGYVKQLNIAIFSVAVLVALSFGVRAYLKRRKKEQES